MSTSEKETERIKILIAEDMDIYITIYKSFLEDLYDLSFAKNGIDAVELFRKEKPDIVFMDILMPEENGIEAIQKIRMSDQNIPVIAVTVLDNKQEKNSIMEHGFADYLVKPLKRNALIEAVEKYCRKKIFI